MPVLAPDVMHQPMIGVYRVVDRNDEAVTASAYATSLQTTLEQIFYGSTFWSDKLRFGSARQRLAETQSLGHDWDTYGSDPPNAVARTLAAKILDFLETTLLPPTRLNPTVEGGIALSFIEGARRAVIEVYNTGEVALATYSDAGEPIVWEPEPTEAQILDSINRIRVHLAA